MSKKDLSIIKSPLNNIMQGVIKEIGIQAKGNIYESSSDKRCYMKFRAERGVYNDKN